MRWTKDIFGQGSPLNKEKKILGTQVFYVVSVVNTNSLVLRPLCVGPNLKGESTHHNPINELERHGGKGVPLSLLLLGWNILTKLLSHSATIYISRIL